MIGDRCGDGIDVKRSHPKYTLVKISIDALWSLYMSWGCCARRQDNVWEIYRFMCKNIPSIPSSAREMACIIHKHSLMMLHLWVEASNMCVLNTQPALVGTLQVELGLLCKSPRQCLGNIQIHVQEHSVDPFIS